MRKLKLHSSDGSKKGSLKMGRGEMRVRDLASLGNWIVQQGLPELRRATNTEREGPLRRVAEGNRR